MQDLQLTLLYAATSAVDTIGIPLQYPRHARSTEARNLKFAVVMLVSTQTGRVRKELLSLFSRGLVESETLLETVCTRGIERTEEALSQLIMEYVDTTIALQKGDYDGFIS